MENEGEKKEAERRCGRRKREVEAGRGIVWNYSSSVVLSIPLPGLHSVVSAGAVAPSAGHVHSPSLGAPQLGKAPF